MLSACGLSESSLFYSETTSDGWDIGYNKLSGNSFLGSYTWDGNYENMTFTLPDTYKNSPVTQLGGYYGSGVPTPFCVYLPSEYGHEGTTEDNPTDTPSRYPQGYTITELKFHLMIGQNLSNIKLTFMYYSLCKQADGSYILYHPVYDIACSGENRTFYSKDGRLYYKANDQLVDTIAYPNND